MHLHDFADSSAESDAKNTCDKLGISHFTADMTWEFAKKVIEPFCSDYMNGRTPNPCIMCNKNLKFGAFLKKANELGYADMATGHYASVEYDAGAGRYLLKKADFDEKDQSYVLYNLTQRELSHLHLPLGTQSKSELRELLREYSVPAADRPESQDICFIPDGDYAGFIRRYTGKDMPPGNFVDASGKVLGRHTGLMCYTPGQRRGLGVSADRRLYVISKNKSDNTVTLGDEPELFYRRMRVSGLNLIALGRLETPVRAEARIRYSHSSAAAFVHPVSETEAVIEFDKPQRAPVCGQSAVFYDGEYVVGGGVITEVLRENS